jgi:hypothetical protein
MGGHKKGRQKHAGRYGRKTFSMGVFYASSSTFLLNY